jgi:rubrerythrin
VNLDPRLKPHEILAVAIKSEIETADLYTKLYEKAKNKILYEKLKFLAFEEGQHRKILEKLFSERFRERKLEIPEKSFLPSVGISLEGEFFVLDLFKEALRAEKMSEEFYKEAQKRAEDNASRKMLEYLSRVERSHYFVIQSEIDLLSKFPNYYDVEDFHFGHDMVHIGP